MRCWEINRIPPCNLDDYASGLRLDGQAVEKDANGGIEHQDDSEVSTTQ